jgi:amino acid adenylation domain-containing protein
MDELSNRISDLSPARRALLALRLKQSGRGPKIAQTIKPRTDRGSTPASFAQQRLWFLHQMDLSDASYNVPHAIRLKGSLDVAALRRTLAEIVQRHEVVRTRFANVEGLLQQVISSDAIPLSVIDLSNLTRAERESKADQLVAAEATKPFDLEQGPVMRTTLLRLEEQEHILLLTFHHVVSDAWSAEILFHELGKLYEAFSSGRPSPLPPLPIQYADFAEWQREYLQGAVLEEQLAYWKRQLAGVNHVLALATDHPRPPIQTFRGKYRSLALPRALSEQLARLSRSEGVTTFMMMLAAFDVLLARYTGQEDVVVGSPILGRNREEIERLIGCFVNTLVLRADLSGNPSFSELLRRVREVALEAYAHQELPFEKLVEELEPERSLSHSPLFQVMFALHHASRAELSLRGLTLEQMPTDTSTSKFDLSLSIGESVKGLTVTFEYNPDLFEASTIAHMAEHFQTLLEAIVSNPGQRLADLPLMTAAEQQIVVDWNKTGVVYSDRSCVHELFEEQVEHTPEAIGLVSGTERLTYRELNERANQLAHYLKQLGVGPEVLVGVFMERSVEMIVGLLGILKAGAAYVPLDPGFPKERLAFMLKDSDVPVLLTQKGLLETLPALSAHIVCLDEFEVRQKLDSEQTTNPRSTVSSENLAYVIYTSGSTGRPKGVQVRHESVVHLFTATREQLGFHAGDIWTVVHSSAFDFSVWEIWGSLLQGGTLLVVPLDVVQSPPDFYDLLCREQVTILNQTPAALRELLRARAQALTRNREWSVRLIVCGGDALDLELAAQLSELGVSVWNFYGPTESTVWTTCSLVAQTEVSAPLNSIGQPITDLQVYVLDQQLQLLPSGVPAELFIGGAGLARGYMNRPELTAEKFIPNPFSEQPGARLYRTGDVGRWRRNGKIEFLGRMDHQVKLRGFRVELGEIETALSQHPEVAQAVVKVREDRPHDKRLVAYVVAKDGQAPSASELRKYLQLSLPDYMVPAAFVMLEAMPLTPTSKVDRRLLPVPDYSETEQTSGFVAPRTPIEEIVADIWARVLGIEKVGVNDNFFELGGHSLLLARMASRIRESFQLELPLRALFEAPTLAALAERIEAARRTTEGSEDVPLVSVLRTGELPLSFAQERLWFFDQLEPGSAAYNIPRALRLKGALDTKALQQSLDAIFARHEVLRLIFLSENGKPKLSFAEPGIHEISVFDLSQLPADEHEEKARELIAKETQRPFDLTRGPLLRLALVRLDVEDHVLVLTMHHIVSDGWSIGIVLRELVSLYNSITTGSDQSLPELQVQYADFAAWQRQYLSAIGLQKQLEFWRAQLEGAPAVINLPADRPRPAVRSFRGERHLLTVSKEVADGLKKIARAESATLFMVLLTAFQLLLSCLTRDDDIVVGSPTAGRNRAETESLIGYFVNTLVLRTKFAADPNFREAVRRVRETTLAAYSNQDVPFENLVEQLRPLRSLKFNSLFQVWFVLQNTLVEQREWRDLTVQSIDLESATTRHDLQLTLWETDNGLEGAFTYSTDLFDPETIDCISEQFISLLAIVIERLEIRLSVLRAKLDDVGRAHRQQRAERLEDAGREKLKSVKRRAVTVGASQD